jgi:phage regulator Rha-like protein
MNSLTQIDVIDRNGELVVDSRLIARELSIEHHTFLKNLVKYLDKIESRFGVVRFEVDKPMEGSSGGRPEKYALLTEPQATTLMTFSRNTDQVVECKLSLVAAFEKAKAVIKTVIPQQSERIRELELQLAVAKEINKGKEIDSSMLTMHGKETVLALRGMSDQIVKSEVLATEIVQLKTGKVSKILTADQLKAEIKKRTGQKIPSLKWVADKLRNMNRDDLLIPVTRHSTSEYVAPDSLDEVIDLIFGDTRQRLIGE